MSCIFRNCAMAAVLFLVGLPGSARGERDAVRIAVASNFVSTLRVLSNHFELAYHYRVHMIPGSTGKLYAQIRNGAPFDLFLAADVRRPRLLEESRDGIRGSRFTYARGRLALWSPRPGFVDDQGGVLHGEAFSHLALANPRLAPYGAAARAVLQKLNLWSVLQSRLVYGENIAQTYQFVAGGNAELGFIALSQLYRHGHKTSGSYWLIPQSLYPPIEQQAILIQATVPARAFLSYLGSEDAKKIIRDRGYDTPGGLP
jgi:molybdate transport system substrate-binding protein